MTKMKWVMRILGLLNVFFGIVGIWYFIMELSWHFQKWSAAYGARDWAVLSLFSLCTLLLICSLGYSGLRLIAGDKTVLRFTIIVFVLEILYFFADVIVFWIILPVSIEKKVWIKYLNMQSKMSLKINSILMFIITWEWLMFGVTSCLMNQLWV